MLVVGSQDFSDLLSSCTKLVSQYNFIGTSTDAFSHVIGLGAKPISYLVFIFIASFSFVSFSVLVGE